jgi:hypothetical protein
LNLISTKSALSQPRQRAIKLFQSVPFGTIHLTLQNGEPIFEPPPRVIETRKMGAQNGPRTESDLEDFCLKQQVIELFQTMDEIRDGVLSITLKHGLPLLVEVERTRAQ